MFFVLSSGRSGSRTSSEVFSQFDNCRCLHHPQPELVQECTDYFYGRLDGDSISSVLRETRVATLDGKIYGEVNLQLSLIQPILRKLFPDAKFIWLVRDGRDSVASMYYRGWYDNPSNTRVPQIWHDARLDGSITGDFNASEWRELSRFAKCCWIWTKYNTIIRDKLMGLPEDKWRKVRLESFRSSLPELAKFLGLRRISRIRVEKHNVAFQPVTQWDRWDANQKMEFEKHCGTTMDELYPDWRDASGDWQPVQREQPDAKKLTEQLKSHTQKFIREVQRFKTRIGALVRRR